MAYIKKKTGALAKEPLFFFLDVFVQYIATPTHHPVKAIG
jgi:hypothetical protein